MSHIRTIEFTGLGEVAVRTAPLPASPAPDEVLLEARFLGICGTDLHVLHGKHPWVKPPLVTGHEAAALVAEAGTATSFKPGDTVVLNPLVACGTCGACRAGRPNHCDHARVIGFRLPGAGRTRFLAPARQLHAVPHGVGPAHAALAEPLAVGIHAAGRAADRERVLIIGGGTIGLSVLLGLLLRGAGEITVAEPVGGKRDLARALGAAAAIPPGEIGTSSRYTTVLDCVAAPATLNAAGQVAIGGGEIVVVGVAAEARTIDLPRLQRFEIDVLGSGMYIPADIDAAIAAIAENRVPVSRLITAIRPLDAAPAAYVEAAAPESVKIMIDMREVRQGQGALPPEPPTKGGALRT